MAEGHPPSLVSRSSSMSPRFIYIFSVHWNNVYDHLSVKIGMFFFYHRTLSPDHINHRAGTPLIKAYEKNSLPGPGHSLIQTTPNGLIPHRNNINIDYRVYAYTHTHIQRPRSRKKLIQQHILYRVRENLKSDLMLLLLIYINIQHRRGQFVRDHGKVTEHMGH